MPRFRGTLALAILAGLLQNGCSSPAPQAARGARQPPAAENTQGWQGRPDDKTPSGFADVDACAGRLQSIEGQLMEYYLVYHRLPARLDELRAYVDIGDVPDYTCPVSHEPYLYVPGGMLKPGDPRVLILYDAAPAHNGMRWGIVFNEPRGRQPVVANVIKIPEPWMRQYAPRSAPPPSTSRPAAAGP